VKTINADQLTDMVTQIFQAAGCSDEESRCIAAHLVDSNLCGHDSHGVIRVSRYIDFMHKGHVKAGQTVSVDFDGGAIVLLDGHMGFGQTLGEQMMRILTQKTHEFGIAMASIKRVGHLGRLGDWGEMLAKENLISLHFLNTTGLALMVTPFGGTDRRLSPNPMAICIPVPGKNPVSLDITTAMSAEGKLFVAKNQAKEVVPGIIIDKDGKPTTDPNDFYAGGAILPMAAHKGSGLNIMIDLLTGAISGGGCTAPGVTVLESTMTSIAIDASRFPHHEAYVAEIERFIDWVKSSRSIQADSPVLVPGERGFETRARRLEEGIPIDDLTWHELLAAAGSVGCTFD